MTSAEIAARRLDLGSVALGVAVGVAASVCTMFALRQQSDRPEHARAPPRSAPSTSSRAAGVCNSPAISRGASAREAVHAASLAQAYPRGGPLPTPIDMASLMNVVLRPPLDERVARMLESTSLCYLSTFSLDSAGEPSPHLSLMRFTYVRGEEVVLISTQRRTKKYEQMCNSPAVAVLVHDFPEDGRGEADARRGSGSLSITLNGTVRA